MNTLILIQKITQLLKKKSLKPFEAGNVNHLTWQSRQKKNFIFCSSVLLSFNSKSINSIRILTNNWLKWFLIEIRFCQFDLKSTFFSGTFDYRYFCLRSLYLIITLILISAGFLIIDLLSSVLFSLSHSQAILKGTSCLFNLIKASWQVD